MRTPGRVSGIAVAVLLATAGAPRAATQLTSPVPSQFFGICPWRVTDFPQVPFGFMGHAEFSWPKVEPSPGVFDFSMFEDYVTDAMQHGLWDSTTNTVPMAITLGLTPIWAASDTTNCGRSGPGGTEQCPAPPANLSDWGTYVRALVGHFDGGAWPHIQFYELWNEADDRIWWAPPLAQEYSLLVTMADTAYAIVHTDPVSQLLTPSVAGTIDHQASWMATYLQAGGAQYADAGAYHGYLGDHNVTPFPMPEADVLEGSPITKAVRMRAVFDTCGMAGKPMYETEGSWGDTTVTDSVTQAAWLSRYMLLQVGERDSTNLQLAAWFAWTDSAFGWGTLEHANGAPNMAARAWAAVYEWAVGARVPNPASGDSVTGTWTLTLHRPGGYVGKAVWNVNGPATWQPGPGFTRYRTLDGQTIPIASGDLVPIGAWPVLVEEGAFTNSVPPPAPARRYALRAWPSVTAGATRLAFGAPLAGPGRVTIWDVGGRMVRALAVPPLSSATLWDGRGASGRAVGPGVYFARLEAGLSRPVARIVVVR